MVGRLEWKYFGKLSTPFQYFSTPYACPRSDLMDKHISGFSPVFRPIFVIPSMLARNVLTIKDEESLHSKTIVGAGLWSVSGILWQSGCFQGDDRSHGYCDAPVCAGPYAGSHCDQADV
jgi:hypothetical protein